MYNTRLCRTGSCVVVVRGHARRALRRGLHGANVSRKTRSCYDVYRVEHVLFCGTHWAALRIDGVRVLAPGVRASTRITIAVRLPPDLHT